MAMARRTWSVATGLARDTLGENLTCPTPSKDCFPECGAKGSRLTVGVWGPGVCSPAVSAHVRARTLWQGRWGTVPKGVRGGEEGGGAPKGVQGGEGGGGGGKGIRVRGLSCFWPGFLRGFLRGFWLFLPPP